MKKSILMTALALLGVMLCFSPAVAQTGGFSGDKNTGGFVGPSGIVSTVEQAKTMRDDSKVILRGNILQHLGGEKYLFADKSGNITIEIEHDEWGGQIIAPADKVEIQGEVDKDWNSVEIDVKRIMKI